MGKARGPKRKEAPARKRLQINNPSSSGLLQKQSRRNKGSGVHCTEGLDGGAAVGKRTLGQMLLVPNKRARGGKRRRQRSNAPVPNQPKSSETATIQAEYASVDARASAKKASEESQRLQAPVKVRLVPATAMLRMPSQGNVSLQALRASSSARMVDALLQSITDDPAPDALPARPVRSAGRKRKGNPYAALQDDPSDEEYDSNKIQGEQSDDTFSSRNAALAGSGLRSVKCPPLTFAAPSGFGGANSTSSGRMSFAGGAVGGGGSGASGVQGNADDDDDDPDL